MPALACTAERAKAYARNARAATTHRAYARDWRDFAAFCAQVGFDALPAPPQAVAHYITALAGIKAVATIRRRLVAIAQMHKLQGFASPTSDPIVREILAGIERTHGVAPRRKSALTVELLKDILHRLDPGLKGIRDRALLLLTFAGGFRRSEVAALDLADVRFETRGAVVTLRRSKTDQRGVGREVAIPQLRTATLCPVQALQAWLAAAAITEGALFRTFSMRGALQPHRIDGRDIARLVQRLARRAHLDGDFGAHSLRAGFITSGAMRGVAEVSLQAVTGHRSTTILRVAPLYCCKKAETTADFRKSFSNTKTFTERNQQWPNSSLPYPRAHFQRSPKISSHGSSRAI
uniref:Phage integrase n=1 Tax=mine drainage metagenome TaxID=410659 RepID=E6PJA6_9ZZZZ